MSLRHDVVFLFDVDNTLLDNDRIQDDLKRHLEREFGAAPRDRYWAILEARYREHIPVVYVAGRRTFTYFVDSAELRDRVEAATSAA